MVGNRRAESASHSMMKHLIASILERQGHKVELEADFGDYIADVYDWTTKFAYEVQTRNQKSIEEEKIRKGLLHGEIFDIIIIRTPEYHLNGILASNCLKKLKYKLGEWERWIMVKKKV